MSEEITLSEKVAKFLKEKRQAMGYSQKEMAIHLFNDVTQQGYLSKIENGNRKITVDTLNILMKKLNAEIDIIEY